MRYSRKAILEQKSRAAMDQRKHYDPMITPWKDLAIAVIFEALKEYVPGAENQHVTEFFESDDYILWSWLADLRVDGATVLHALERNNGIDRGARVLD